MATLADALAIALEHHQAGRLPEAEALYRQILQADPSHADALHLLGVIAFQLGQHEIALQTIGEAIRLKPGQAAFHSNLGEAYRRLGRSAEAIASFQRALQLHAGYAEAHNNLGLALLNEDRLVEAEASCRRAVELKPDYAEAHKNLGYVLKRQGQLAGAITCYRRALELRPDLGEVHNNLGIALAEQRRLAEAVGCYREALRLEPDMPASHNNLGAALCLMGYVQEAVASFRQALHLRPEFADAQNNLGNALKDQGQMEQAIGSFRRAMQLEPNNAVFHSNLVYALPFCPDYDTQAISEELQRWNQQHAAPLAPSLLPHANDRAPNRRLRVGYVSPNFATHPVGQFLLPLLEAHHHESIEIFCYASVRASDGMTDRCRAQADVWRDVLALTDDQLADVIRHDRIDILVDLAMHMEGSRMLVFARKPAPVQVTYLAYPGSTGLATMDYRLTDPYLDPPGGADEQFYVERSIRLSETYWCYRSPLEALPVAALPALRAGRITFGCLNNFCKVSEPTLLAWTRLLQALPDARLLLHAKAGSHRERVHQLLAEHQVAPERFTFVDTLSPPDYFRFYERIDVALDPFPYGGGTTTCDALWMGVPVVSLAGRTAVGRGGLSILSNVGMAELVAQDAEDYVRRAQALASDLQRLSKLRSTLRQRLQGSPLMDAPRFARHVEAAYRGMWEQFCRGNVC